MANEKKADGVDVPDTGKINAIEVDKGRIDRAEIKANILNIGKRNAQVANRANIGKPDLDKVDRADIGKTNASRVNVKKANRAKTWNTDRVDIMKIDRVEVV